MSLRWCTLFDVYMGAVAFALGGIAVGLWFIWQIAAWLERRR